MPGMYHIHKSRMQVDRKLSRRVEQVSEYLMRQEKTAYS